MGSWQLESGSLTVSYTLLQPHIIGGTIGLSGLTQSKVREYAENHFSPDTAGSPSIIKTLRYCQLMGQYAVPFADRLMKDGVIHSSRVSFNLVVLSKTQPLFTVVDNQNAFECKLTHMSCRIIAEVLPESVRLSFPTSTGHNFTFRSSQLRAGGGTGPSLTVHTSGVVQYQGAPNSVKMVTSGFRECIDQIMSSSHAIKFIKSLAVLRKLPIP